MLGCCGVRVDTVAASSSLVRMRSIFCMKNFPISFANFPISFVDVNMDEHVVYSTFHFGVDKDSRSNKSVDIFTNNL